LYTGKERDNFAAERDVVKENVPRGTFVEGTNGRRAEGQKVRR
jgi:hypothetical protein